MLEDFTRFAPRWATQREKRVQRILRKHLSVPKFRRAEMTELLEHGKIDNQITDRDSDARFTFFRLKDTEWEILDGKMRVARDFKERLERHWCKEEL